VPEVPSVTVTSSTEILSAEKLAVTESAPVIETTHGPVPEQAPDHPVNTEPAAGVAVSVTDDPHEKLAEHVAPQLIPAGELATLPLPTLLTVRVWVPGAESVAVMTAPEAEMEVTAAPLEAPE
jgi:hypothetical protein